MKKVFFYGLFVLFISFNAIAEPRFEADVSVDVTAKTVTEAKKQAVSKAMREGLREVVLGISTEETVKEINKLNDNQLEHFIAEVMVLMEKTSDVRYIANFRISVDEKVLKAYMAENNMPIVLGEEQDVLVIPLLEKEDESTDVWEDDNFWRQAFLERKNIHKGNLNIKLIEKNLGNLAMIKTNRVYNMENAEYQELAAFNRVDAAYVLKYSLKDKKVYIKEFPSRTVQELTFTTESSEEVADKAIAMFKDVKKKTVGDAMTGAVPVQIEVIYNYAKLGDWMALKNILDNNPQVQDVKIISMANSKVHFNFQYSGVIEKLQGSLDVNGYKMRQEGEHYVIY